MIAVPAEIPVTLPDASIVPVAVLPLLQVPPGVASLSGIVWPLHTISGPVMDKGDWFTVTICVAMLTPTV